MPIPLIFLTVALSQRKQAISGGSLWPEGSLWPRAPLANHLCRRLAADLWDDISAPQ